jgi:hypothetical protein
MEQQVSQGTPCRNHFLEIKMTFASNETLDFES